MEEIIRDQIAANHQLNLFFENLEEEILINENFKEKVLELKKSGFQDIEEHVDQAVEQTINTIYRINQYLDIPAKEVRSLRRIYFSTWNNLEEDNFREVMNEHHRKLSEWISRFYPEPFISALKSRRRIGCVVNSEYSPEFQEQVLGIELRSLLEPVIDLGCGKHGNLVKKINETGKRAIGIDRVLAAGTDYLLERNWFDFYMEKGKWGTIFANMSFTNHMIYAFKNESGNLYKFLLKYNEIVESLKTDGQFIYAPSVPLVEERLDPDRYRIIRRNVTGEYSVTRVIKLGNAVDRHKHARGEAAE